MKTRSLSLSALAAAVVIGGITAAPKEAAACGDSWYLGSICTVAETFCPRGTMEANGALLTISGNEALYSLLGVQYGGDGRTNFKLPDLRGRSIVGQGQGPGLTNVVQGQNRGAETVTLTENQMPVHNHEATFAQTGGGVPMGSFSVSTSPPNQAQAAAGSYLSAKPIATGGANVAVYTNGTGTATEIAGLDVSAAPVQGQVTVDDNGGGQPFYIINPQQALRFCVVTQGIYPPRS